MGGGRGRGRGRGRWSRVGRRKEDDTAGDEDAPLDDEAVTSVDSLLVAENGDGKDAFNSADAVSEAVEMSSPVLTTNDIARESEDGDEGDDVLRSNDSKDMDVDYNNGVCDEADDISTSSSHRSPIPEMIFSESAEVKLRMGVLNVSTEELREAFVTPIDAEKVGEADTGPGADDNEKRDGQEPQCSDDAVESHLRENTIAFIPVVSTGIIQVQLGQEAALGSELPSPSSLQALSETSASLELLKMYSGASGEDETTKESEDKGDAVPRVVGSELSRE